MYMYKWDSASTQQKILPHYILSLVKTQSDYKVF